MAPAPNVLVIMNDGGKEIGGGNHYCTICRVPPPRTLATVSGSSSEDFLNIIYGFSTTRRDHTAPPDDQRITCRLSEEPAGLATQTLATGAVPAEPPPSEVFEICLD
ncbi:hypothetical protein VP01_3775g6 [Puccinia sorghi]|uniref:Uncharacterized protein n=1 Tax=Puccinia sorghi TaxID=27349 RepID=A0A0L6UUI5_9BASI|nr:hypothetical protein VP01_3775g6 [Puccinia sorghi]